MKAIAVLPGKKNSIHLRDVPDPVVEDVPHGRGVLVRVLQVGVDGTDREINAAEYGAAPPGDDYLILGHESFGQVAAVGPRVTEFAPGDFVVATVRRPGTSAYDRIGLQDMTTDDVYLERGINLRHGFLAEYYVDSADFLVKMPPALEPVAVLMEPTSIAEKAINQAYEIQRRLHIWTPRRAAVLGLTQPPHLNAELVEAIGGRYISTQDESLTQVSARYGPFDFILEGTGFSPLVFEAMEVLGKNGVLAQLSVTGGDRKVNVPADRINQGFVLGNKVAFGSVSASRGDFDRGVRFLVQAESTYPGWLARLLPHPVQGLERYEQLLHTLTSADDAIKVYCEVASVSSPRGSRG